MKTAFVVVRIVLVLIVIGVLVKGTVWLVRKGHAMWLDRHMEKASTYVGKDAYGYSREWVLPKGQLTTGK